jgi:glycosyltransferase involved in cell wall biosynthesis
MKICQVLYSQGSGGLERHAIDLCNGLAQTNEVVFVGAEEYRSRLDKSIYFEPVNVNCSRRNVLAVWRLYRILRNHAPEIIHAQANKAVAMVARLVPFLSSATVATIHNVKRGRQAFKKFDRIIAVSSELAQQFPDRKVDVIFNGIEPPQSIVKNSTLLRTMSPEGYNGPCILAVGRLVPAKGFDILLRAWRQIDSCLFIAGDGEQRGMLESMIIEYGLADRVFLLGHRSDVFDLMASADLLVISSRREGFPYVMVEALHAGTIVVSTRVPGASEILPDAVLLPCEDVGQLRERVKVISADLETFRDLYEPVWQLARSELTVEMMCKRTNEIYKQLV